MNTSLMMRAFGWAACITLILIILGVALWYHVIITVIVLVVGWFTLMVYTDPPENWN